MIARIVAVAVIVAPLHAQVPPGSARGASAAQGPVVDVTGGKLRGVALTSGGASFLGIPYARAPVGPLRWREPAPVESWTGIRDAAAHGSPCAQNPYFMARAKELAREDCLYLNVWTPDTNRAHGRKPVMVWIPGGGNFAGGANARTSGESLIQHDVVIVTLNYRLGLFGFFSHPDLTRESPHHASGNQGLLDQIAALRWVQANIAAFGGDPANVTIFGESAGALNVSVLLTSPLTRGLFHRAIAQSGSVSVVSEPLSLKDAESRGESLASSWGAGATPSISALRSLPADAILKAEPDFLDKPQPNLGITIDGYVFPTRPATVFAQGRAHPVPMLIGNLAHEWVPGVRPPTDLMHAIEADYAANVAKRALSLYGGIRADSLYGTPAEQWVEDTGFRCPAIAQLVWHTSAKNVTYEFQIEHLPAARRQGNTHAQDVPYVFGQLDADGYEPFDHAMSDVIQKYWTNFAKTGDPNGPGLPRWPAFDPTSRAYIAFTDDGAVAKKDLRRPFCDLFVENLKR
jgi:para-nitrobenzyl esterase